MYTRPDFLVWVLYTYKIKGGEMDTNTDLYKMYYTKSVALHTCEKYYYWVYKRHLVPREKPKSLERGAFVHDTIEKAIKLQKKEKLTSQDAIASAFALTYDSTDVSETAKEEATSFIQPLWDVLSTLVVKDSERVVSIPIRNNPPTVWTGKIDLLLEDEDGGLWLGEIKTTKSSMNSIRKLYTRHVQPWTYIYLIQSLYFVKGIKIIVATPTEAQIETVPLSSFFEQIAIQYVKDSVHKGIELEQKIQQKQPLIKNRNMCLTHKGECAYWSICAPGLGEDSQYYNDIVKQLFNIRNPDEHLNPKED